MTRLMIERTRAFRRYHIRKIKEKIKQRLHNSNPNWNWSEADIGILANTPKISACSAHTNPRKEWNGLEKWTIQERKEAQNEDIAFLNNKKRLPNRMVFRERGRGATSE